MKSFLKKKQLWGSIIALLLLGYCVKDNRLSDVRNMLERTDLYYLLLAVLLQFMFIICKAVRWRTIVEPMKKIKWTRVIPLFSAGQAINIVMPALTGQVGRLLLFSRKEELSKTYVFSTIVLEVVFDAIGLLTFIMILSAASMAFPARYRTIAVIIAVATVIIFVLLYLILLNENRIGAFCRRLFRGRWPGFYITLKKFVRSFTRGLKMLRSTQYFFRTLGFSILGWLSQMMVIYSLFCAFGFKLPLISATLLMVINTIALMIPITPGNAGTFELAVVAPLLAFKIAKSDAVLYALALHIIDLVPIFIMGYLFFYTEKMTLKQIKEEGSKKEVLDEFNELRKAQMENGDDAS
jgi:uncharacterized protein (TIRG00374 family)